MKKKISELWSDIVLPTECSAIECVSGVKSGGSENVGSVTEYWGV